MKTFLIVIAILGTLTIISYGHNMGKNSLSENPECDFAGSFSNAQNGPIWFTISQNGEMKLANGEKAILVEIDKNQCSGAFGQPVDNIICVKKFGAWLICKIYKPNVNWNTNYLIISTYLQPIYKFK